MQSASALRSVPPRKTPREGQSDVKQEALARKTGVLAIQLPTGYGKTFTAADVFRALWVTGEVNRLLYIVPTRAQLDQFCKDGESEFLDAGLAGVIPLDVGYSPQLAVKQHRTNGRVVFAATIQAVVSGAVGLAVKEMLHSGTWMFVVDEYHHYGIERAWGRAILDLSPKFLLAMSATPERKNQDSAFGPPALRVTYRKAVADKAVKKLRLHAYEYRIDAITVNNEVRSFTTTDVVAAAGSDDPNAIDKFIVDQKLRWSPKYISPLVSIPIERLLARRGGYPLQMIVGAMGCLHARMVSEQLRSMFGDASTNLRIDWVGTGPHGRSDAENDKIIRQFCPPKREDGKRHPADVQLDILVHVGMAGEGLDSVFVSEIVHLNKASISNQNDQENGRASRRIPNAPEKLQFAYINVDSSSPYAEWSGSKIETVFDRENGEAPPEDDDESEEALERELSELPDEPTIVIADCELQHIDKGDPEVRGCMEALVEAGGWDRSILSDPDHEAWDAALLLRRRELIERAKGQEGMSVLMQLRQSLNSAVGSVASRAARLSGIRFERSLIGDMKKRVFTEMRRRFGTPVDQADEKQLRERYTWVKALEQTVIKEGLPPWMR